NIDGSMVVEVTGELDVAGSAELTEFINNTLKKFPKRVILNLDGVGYMASSGLAMLVAVLKKSREMRVMFGICGLSPVVRHSIEVTALHEILPIFSDVTEAIRKLA
ncbi:MAG: STAS domain-containing protein, partial [Candidatus Omnitrophica bacterium]|nr:STAS domain-containing protein [Candidatus Omnitrophota bacterium]